MKEMFDEIRLGNLVLGNRLIRSATHEAGGADKGVITPLLETAYGELVVGGVGLIITGMMGVAPNGCLNGSMARIYGDTFVPDFARLATRVHASGGKLMVQIAHCGVKAKDIAAGETPKGPSDMAFQPDNPAKAMTKEEIRKVAVDFAAAAYRCKEAGADGVQIHGAHGYLLSEFLNPFFNKRTDEYGGSLENRARIVFEVYDAVRKAVGDEYPVWIKINYQDMTDPQFTGEECLWVCGELDRRGIDAVEVSAGAGSDSKTAPSRRFKEGDTEGSNLAAGLEVAAKINAPVVSVGTFRSPGGIEAALNSGGIEAVAMCRPLIAEPGLIRRWRNGDKAPAICISCNKCFGMPSLGCAVFKK